MSEILLKFLQSTQTLQMIFNAISDGKAGTYYPRISPSSSRLTQHILRDNYLAEDVDTLFNVLSELYITFTDVRVRITLC